MLGQKGQIYSEPSQFRPHVTEDVSPKTRDQTMGISLSFLAEIFKMMVPHGHQLQWNPDKDDTTLDYWFPKQSIANAIASFLDYIAKNFNPGSLKKEDSRKDNLSLPSGEDREDILRRIKIAIEKKMIGEQDCEFEQIEGLYLAILGWYGIIFHMQENLIEDWLFLRQNQQINIRENLERKYKTTPGYILDIFEEFLQKVKDSDSIDLFCEEFGIIICKMQFSKNFSGLTDEELQELLYTENLYDIIYKIATTRSAKEHNEGLQTYSEVSVKAKLFFNPEKPLERVTIDIRFDKIEVVRDENGKITEVRIRDFKSGMLGGILTLSAGELLQWVLNIIVVSELVSKLSRDPVKSEDDFKFFLVEIKLWEFSDHYKHAKKLARVKQSWIPTGENVDGKTLDFEFSLTELMRVLHSIADLFEHLLDCKKRISELRKSETKKAEYPVLAFPKPPPSNKVSPEWALKSPPGLQTAIVSENPYNLIDRPMEMMDGVDLIEPLNNRPILKIIKGGRLTEVTLYKGRGSSFRDAQIQYVFNGPDVLDEDNNLYYGITRETLYIVINGEVFILSIPQQRYFALKGLDGIFCFDQPNSLIYLSLLTPGNLPAYRQNLNLRVNFERKKLPGFQKTNDYAFYDNKYYPIFEYKGIFFIKYSVNIYFIVDKQSRDVYNNRFFTTCELLAFADASVTREQWDKVFEELELSRFPVNLYYYNDRHGNPQPPYVEIIGKNTSYPLSEDNTFTIDGIIKYGLYLGEENEVMAYRLHAGFNGSMLEREEYVSAIEQ